MSGHEPFLPPTAEVHEQIEGRLVVTTAASLTPAIRPKPPLADTG